MAVAVDATSGIKCPANAAQWTELGYTSTYTWGLQDTSGDAVEGDSGLVLTAVGSVSYANAISGWTRKGVGTNGGANQRFTHASGAGVNVGTTSVAWLVYANMISTAAVAVAFAARQTTDVSVSLQTSNLLRLRSTGIVSGVADPRGQVRPYLLVYDRTNSLAKLYTDQEIISATYGSVADGTKGLGSTSTTTTTVYAYAAQLSGGAAESLSVDANAGALLYALGWSPSWYTPPLPEIFGDADQPLGAVTSTGAGTVAISGDASTTLGSLTSTGAGALAISGNSLSALGPLSAFGTGEVEVTLPEITGNADQQLGELVSFGTGRQVAEFEPNPLPATTTAPAIRDAVASAIHLLAIADAPAFRESQYALDGDFVDWAERNPAAALRRYSVRYVNATQDGDHDGVGVEWRTVGLTIVVAYPQTNRHGATNALAREDVMTRDRRLIDEAVGLLSFDKLEPAQFIASERSRVVGSGIDFLVIANQYGYWAAR